MNIINAVILGIVQGITEFLPVSSSGHLVLLQKIFGITEPALFFDTMLHLGTLAAVFAVLHKDIWAVLKKPVQPLTGFLLLATIPVVVFALVFGKTVEHIFETGSFLGWAFLATSALLTFADYITKRAAGINCLKKAENMNWIDALIIGLLQAIAIVPGISRSGATISGALSRRLDKDFAGRFSFLLSIPAILGAVVLQTKDILKFGITHETERGEISIMTVIVGAIIAAVVCFFAIRFMLKIIREKSLRPFAVYTAALGLFILFDQFKTHLIF